MEMLKEVRMAPEIRVIRVTEGRGVVGLGYDQKNNIRYDFLKNMKFNYTM